MITFETPPLNVNLTTLAAVKTELLVSGSSHDDFLTSLIEQASESICSICMRRFERVEVTETLAGTGDYLASVSRIPVASLVSASLDGEDQTLDGISIYEPVFGQLYRESGWNDTRPRSRPWAGAKLWSLRYWAGYLLPGDDVVASTISVAASDDSYNDTGSGFPLLVAGDLILALDFTESANNGYKVVASATRSKIIVTTELTTEAADDDPRTLAVRTLPRSIERACIDLVRAGYAARDRDPTLVSKSIDDVSATYRTGSDAASLIDARDPRLAPYVRLVP